MAALCEALEFPETSVEGVLEANFIPQRAMDNVGNFLVVLDDSYKAQVPI